MNLKDPEKIAQAIDAAQRGLGNYYIVESKRLADIEVAKGNTTKNINILEDTDSDDEDDKPQPKK
eukprot:CAMPEP_0197846436 /NCGR_PEP_ID=MMETSP1438-20131217/3175_1 /TAXON_ID=1461541 /ORGANISM="Pterosperma sp., Strain CCMP1384" /LENGTH=64 /DNA_ID=CAMNT_0043458085 /DNA_START=329 /DNA_END=523 /DNA_ORIENTATION=-